MKPAASLRGVNLKTLRRSRAPLSLGLAGACLGRIDE